MVEEMPKMSREFLEEESLKVAQRQLGCGDLQAVKVARAQPPGGRPKLVSVRIHSSTHAHG
jgi:hypothetical protein